jgi:TolB-like protein/tetratricopeptide (TPR) repeat protein
VLGWGILSFAVLQIYEPVMHGLHLPEWTLTLVVVILGVGFPATFVLAWIFDMGPGGVERTPSAPTSPAAPARRIRTALLLMGLGLVFSVPGWVWYARHERGSATAAAPRAAPSLAGGSGPTRDGSEPPAGPSIAVLPFADMSEKHDQEYFADGVAEEVLNELAHVKGLKVIGRTSAFSFKGKNEDLRVVAQKLGVNHVLEGSVRRQGGRILITAQLIRARDGSHAWSERYERDAGDIFAIQRDVARSVTAALQVAMGAGDTPSLAAPPSTSAAAYNHYLLGVHHSQGFTLEGQGRAIGEFRKAIALDPGYAPAWEALSDALYWLAQARGTARDSPELEEALAAAEKAVSLAPHYALAYLARGLIREGFRWDWEGARSDYERAIELNPGSSRALRRYAVLMGNLGRDDLSLPYYERALVLDPLDSGTWNAMGSTLVDLGKLEAARKALDRCLAIAPEHILALQNLADCDLLEGRTAEAAQGYVRIEAGAYRLLGMVMVNKTLGRERESLDAMAALEAEHGAAQPTFVAQAHAWRGENDEAFRWLDRAVAQHDQGLREIKHDRYTRGLRGDPRFKALLRKMKLPVD